MFSLYEKACVCIENYVHEKFVCATHESRLEFRAGSKWLEKNLSFFLYHHIFNKHIKGIALLLYRSL
jgi:hypothetical protein